GRGGRRVGGGTSCSRARLQGGRLCAHVGQQVDGRLLHVQVGRGRTYVGHYVVVDVEPPRPLHGASAEDQGAAGGSIQRQPVRRSALDVGAAVVDQVLRHRERSGGQVDQAGGAEAVVEVFVPLVADRLVTQGDGVAARQPGHWGIAPEAEPCEGRRQRVRCRAPIDGEDGTAQLVFGPAAVCGRAEARVAPAARPRRRVGRIVDLVVQCLLVGDQRAVRRAGTVDAVLPAGLPEVLVPGEVGDVDAEIAGTLDRRAHLVRPVFVVAGREQH